MTATQNAAAAIKPQASFEFPDTPAASLLKASVDSRHMMTPQRKRFLSTASAHASRPTAEPGTATRFTAKG
jgi:hypothetical protein